MAASKPTSWLSKRSHNLLHLAHFGSVRRNLTPISDSLSLRLRLSGLTLLRRTTRRLIKQKAHRHTCPLRGIVLRLLVGIRFQVLFHSPHRGSFHLSLTVLVHYRSSGSI